MLHWLPMEQFTHLFSARHRAVYCYSARWRADGTFEHPNQVSNRADRLAQGQLPTPLLALVDAQSVKLAPSLGQQRGLNAYKRVNDRKRQVICDTDRRIWRVVVHAADEHDSRGAQLLLPACNQLRPTWAIILHITIKVKVLSYKFCAASTHPRLVASTGKLVTNGHARLRAGG